MIRSSNDESIMINHSEEQYFLMATTDPKEVKFVGWSNSCSQIQLNLRSQLLYKSMKQIMGLFLPSIVQQYAKVNYFSGVVQKYYVIQLHNSLVQCHKYCSSVLSVIVKQLQQLSTLSYSTIATIVQCSQLQYNSYRSLGAILRFLICYN